MMISTPMQTAAHTDAELVARSVAGDREAFGSIVGRYQSLVCSVAYSATGSVGRSEDVAQDTFIEAWGKLRNLREPDKLRAWLCGIARNRANNSSRRERREPVARAGSTEVSADSPDVAPSPSDQAISREEETLLWRALESVPELYREPLVMFYRENQSVERVAEALELSEDAVKQRLSRGRSLVREQMLSFVEGALRRSSPGKALTLGILAALPVMGTSASAATAGAAAVKGGMIAKSAALVAGWNFLLGPLIGVVGGSLGARASYRSAKTDRERRYLATMTKRVFAGVGVFSTALSVFVFCAAKYWRLHPVLFAALGLGIPAIYLAWLMSFSLRANRDLRRIRQEDQRVNPELFKNEVGSSRATYFEYRSRSAPFGLPLVHLRFGAPPGESPKAAKGWIAIGDRAVGVLFAMGGIAAGGVSLGGVSVGLVSLGGAALGGFAFGGFAAGGFALGGVAIGSLAAGGMAVGWKAAAGGMALAGEYALGGEAVARHGNDLAAREFFFRHNWLNPQSFLFKRFAGFVAYGIPSIVVVFVLAVARFRRR